MVRKLVYSIRSCGKESKKVVQTAGIRDVLIHIEPLNTPPKVAECVRNKSFKVVVASLTHDQHRRSRLFCRLHDCVKHSLIRNRA